MSHQNPSDIKPSDAIIQMKLAKLAKLEEQAELRRKFPHLYMHKWYKWSKEFFDDWTTRKQILTAANQLGKGVKSCEQIPTPSGFVLAKDLKIGDEIFGSDGRVCKIIDIPWRGQDLFYRVHFNDDTYLDVTQSHLWKCKTYKERFRKIYTSRGRTWENPDLGKWIVLDTKQIIAAGKYSPTPKSNAHKVCIPYTRPVQFDAIKTDIDFYALGVILGDGHINADGYIAVSKPDEFINGHLESIGFKRGETLGPVVRGRLAWLPKELCGKVAHEKFIPQDLLMGSIEQRLALLRGLMDTDGTVNKDGNVVEFDSTSKALADGVMSLVFSLGGTCKSFYRSENRYQLRIKMPEGLNPFLSPVKADLWRGKIRYRHERVIDRIEEIGVHEGVCFRVDSEDECFLAGQNYVVTHNSSSMIKKLIDMAISPERWPKAWPELTAAGQAPSQWWYLYPTKDVATVEFNEKWKMFLPNVPADDPRYGWTTKKGSYATVHSIHFNSGVTIYFKAYKQDVQALQTGTAAVVACDEELPIALLPELQMRVNATNGFLFFVFTATMGQKFWREVVEERTKWPDARVWQVSLYDSMKYMDGTPSMWTKDRIEAAKRSCLNENEIQRRIMGRFVVDSGLLFPQFDEEQHVKPYHPLPADWEIYAGIDYGTGGNAHPAAIVVCGVNPEHTQVRVIRAWRGDRQHTTAQDIVNEYLDLTHGLNITVAYYDYGPGGRDIGTIATRMGLPFSPADKGQETGRAIIASLLKNNALAIYHSDDEGLQQVLQTGKMVDEFLTAVDKADKRAQRNDDLLDALRYCLSKVGFDWDAMAFGEREQPKPKVLTIDDLRRQSENEDDETSDLEEELEFWQEYLEM